MTYAFYEINLTHKFTHVKLRDGKWFIHDGYWGDLTRGKSPDAWQDRRTITNLKESRHWNVRLKNEIKLRIEKCVKVRNYNNLKRYNRKWFKIEYHGTNTGSIIWHNWNFERLCIKWNNCGYEHWETK